MKRVLIFGVSGTLGQALQNVFRAFYYDVIGLDIEGCDITQADSVLYMLDTLKPDIVINTAALNEVDTIETDDSVYSLAKEVNGVAPGIIARACVVRKLLFVHYSTDYVFDGNRKSGYKEDEQPHPLNRYADTKFFGEKNVIYAGGYYYLIRISRLFGNAGFGVSSKRSFVDTMLYLSASRDHLDVVSDQYSSLSYAPDVAGFTKLLIESEYAPGIYHGSNSGKCSWYEWAEKIFAIKQIDIRLNKVSASHFSRIARVPMHSVLLNTKAPAQRSWQEALEEHLKG